MISVLFKLLSFDSDALYEFIHKFSTVNSPFTLVGNIFNTAASQHGCNSHYANPVHYLACAAAQKHCRLKLNSLLFV